MQDNENNSSDQQQDNQQSNQADQLKDIRLKAIAALSNIVLNDPQGEPQQRFETALNILNYGPNSRIADFALNAALEIQDTATKADLLSQLISELSYLEDSITA